MKKRVLSLLPLAFVLVSLLCIPAFALTEAEVEAQVAASSKEAVTGNVLIWFLCAVAFLKISQKIDSILASMGVNVGRTGGSLMAEAMIAARAVGMVVKAGGGAAGGVRQGGSSAGTAPTGGFFKGGLIGMAGRHITNSAVKTATTQTAAVHTAQRQSDTASVNTASTIQTGEHTSSAVQTDGAHTASSVHTASSTETGGFVTDTTGIIQTEHSNRSATFQSDSPVSPGSDGSSGESPSASDVYSDAMTQQEGIIYDGHEFQPAVFADSSSYESVSSGGASGSGPVAGFPSSPADSTTISQQGGAFQVSNSANSSQTVHSPDGGEHIHTQSRDVQSTHTNSSRSTIRQTSIGGAVFARSLASGGRFANDVIGSVARGEVAGSITGDMAAQSLHSYLGYTAAGKTPPIFYNPEIGRGRITGSVSSPDHPQPIAFGMYNAAQYTEPKGPFTKVRTVDGSLWYTQLAQDTVERKPYKAPDGKVAYDESIVKKLPDPPKRKDRI